MDTPGGIGLPASASHNYGVRAHGNGMRGDSSEACCVVHGCEFAQGIGVAGRGGRQHGHAEGRWYGRGDTVFIWHKFQCRSSTAS